MSKLTKRETEVIELLTKGLVFKEIASKLSIAVRTVDTHVKNMKTKTESLTTYQLVYWYCNQIPKFTVDQILKASNDEINNPEDPYRLIGFIQAIVKRLSKS